VLDLVLNTQQRGKDGHAYGNTIIRLFEDGYRHTQQAKDICFIGAQPFSGGGRGGYFTKSGGVFQSFLRENTNLPLTNNTEGVTLNLMNALFVTTTTTTTTTAFGGPRGGCAL